MESSSFISSVKLLPSDSVGSFFILKKMVLTDT